MTITIGRHSIIRQVNHQNTVVHNGYSILTCMFKCVRENEVKKLSNMKTKLFPNCTFLTSPLFNYTIVVK